MVGQIMEMVRTNRNVGPLIERGLSEDTTNRTTVVAIKALANPTDLSANTPPFPWNKNYLSSLELCSMPQKILNLHITFNWHINVLTTSIFSWVTFLYIDCICRLCT